MKKRIVLLVHGFMVHDWHDFGLFKKYMDEHPVENTEFELVYLYDREKSKTSKPKAMVETLKKIVQEKQKEDYDILLCGYSFSCGIVAKVAQETHCSGVIYLSPTVSLFKTKLFWIHLKNAFKVLKLRLKKGKEKAEKIMKRTKTKGVVSLSYHISLSMIKTKKYYKSSVPYLLFKGSADEYSLDKDLYYIAKKSTAKQAKTVTVHGPDWNHFYILFEEYLTKEPMNEILAFLRRIPHE